MSAFPGVSRCVSMPWRFLELANHLVVRNIGQVSVGGHADMLAQKVDGPISEQEVGAARMLAAEVRTVITGARGGIHGATG